MGTTDNGTSRRTLLARAAGTAGGLTALEMLSSPASALASAPSDWINVKDPAYGAVGDFNTDDTAAIQSALSASAAGGVVYFPPGSYRVSAPLQYYPKTRWLGANVGASTITFSPELWTSGSAPARAIVPHGFDPANPRNGEFDQNEEWSIEHMTILGAGWQAVNPPNYTNTHTNGIVCNANARISCCYIQGFYVGVEIVSDHNRIEYSFVTHNTFNVEFSDLAYSHGNQMFHASQLSTAWLASIHLGGGSPPYSTATVWDASTMFEVHLGGAPVGILKTGVQTGWDANGNPTFGTNYAGGISGCVFTGTYIEGVSNGVMLDVTADGLNHSLVTTHWNTPSTLWAGTPRTDAPLDDPQYQGAWAFNIRWAGGTVLDMGESAITTPPGGVGAINLRDGGELLVRCNSFPEPTYLGSGSTYSGVGMTYECNGNPSMANGRAYDYSSTGVITAGDLVEIVPESWGTVQRATGENPIFGVAITSVANPDGGAVLVQTEGIATINTANGTFIHSGKPIWLDPSTPYLVAEQATSGGKTLGFAVVNTQNSQPSIEGVVLRLS